MKLSLIEDMATALVLSAGGMFGAWQAGAWAELAKVWQPDIVIGASAGALNGWAIAGDCPPDELIARWTHPDTARLMNWRSPPLPWSWLDPNPLAETARELTERYHPQVPFAAVLVEMPSMRVHLFRHPEITWRHLAASCAIPGAFPPVKLDGKWFVDGGLLGPLPLWAAEQLGADRVLALDALPSLPSVMLRKGAGLLRSIAPPKPSCNLPVLTVVPGQTLGALRDAVRWKSENAARWVQMGRDDLKLALCRISGFIG